MWEPPKGKHSRVRRGPWKLLNLQLPTREEWAPSWLLIAVSLLWPHYISRPTNWDNKRHVNVASSGSCLHREVIIISLASWPLWFPSSRAAQVCLWVSSCLYSPWWLELLGYKGPTLVLGEPVAESQVGSWRGLWGCFEFYRGKELWESLRPPARKKGSMEIPFGSNKQ